MFLAITAAASVLAGAIASVSGFGIGSLLTPLFNIPYDMRLAVAAVSIPHLVATSLRLWLMRRDVNRQVLRSFGVMSATGGLTGAILQQYATAPGLTLVFAALLIFAGLAGLTGLSERLRFGPRTGWIAGVLSGMLGGLVGNQGGIRSAALLGSQLSPAAFVATATAAGLIVDAARMPVYVVMEHSRLLADLGVIGVATLGVVVGTVAGRPILRTLPPALFRKLVSALILVLGVYMLTRA